LEVAFPAGLALVVFQLDQASVAFQAGIMVAYRVATMVGTLVAA
jgi:hypothetical protein